MGRVSQRSKARGYRFFYSRLEPGQSSFEPQRNLLGATGALDGGATVAAGERGQVFAVWHGRRPGAVEGDGRVVFVAKSSDDGKTFARGECRLHGDVRLLLAGGAGGFVGGFANAVSRCAYRAGSGI